MVTQLVSTTPFHNDQDFVNYWERLKAVPSVIDQTIVLLSEGIKSKIVLPKIISKRVESQITGLITSLDDIFVTPLPRGIAGADVLEKIKKEVDNGVKKSFEHLLEYLQTTYTPACRDSISAVEGISPEYYNFVVKKMTTTNKTFEEIHKIGLDEVARIRQEMDDIAKKNGFDFQGYKDHLKSDPTNYFTSEKDFLSFVRDWCKRVDAKLPYLFGKLPRCPYGVEAIPAYEAPSSAGAYYIGPGLECTHPGVYYVNTYDLESRPKYLYGSTTLHETVPGHHLQIALATEADLPKFRQLTNLNAYVEGWALYAEGLGFEMGLYEDDIFAFGRYSDEMFRACRLVVDTGMHAKGWTRDRAIAYLVDNTPMGRTDIESEVDRYIAWPGQALSYKMGELQILNLRETLTMEMPKKFDVREFHDILLAPGALPLYLLEDYVFSQFCAKFQVKCPK